MLKKQALLLSVLYSIVLAALSLFKVNVVTQGLPDNSDKVFHTIAYTILTLLCFFAFYYRFKLKKIKAIVFAILFSVSFGILIEILQGALTEDREADFKDVIANTIGAIVAVVVIIPLKRDVKNK